MQLEKRITPATRAVVCTHTSNVCSVALPITKIGALCKRRGIRLIVDAAQSAGLLPIDMKAMLEKFPKDIPVMGNVDPAGVLRLGTPELVREKTLALLDACAGYENFVVSSGCDIPPMSPWENLDAFFAAVEEHHVR